MVNGLKSHVLSYVLYGMHKVLCDLVTQSMWVLL